jgi:flagellar basal body-associated protein FliL
MAFYNKTDKLPRDPTAIEESARAGSGIVSAVIILLIIAAAGVFYLMYVGSGPTEPTIAPPVTENAPAPAPTQPPAQTP